MPQPNYEKKDYTQAIRESYDPQLERLRVDAIINDGTDALIVNSDGSINVNVVSGSSSSDYKSYFNEVTAVASATLTTIQSYTVPGGKTANLQKIDISGTNIGEYTMLVNGVIQNKVYTYFTTLNNVFDFTGNGQAGYPLTAGDVVQVKVIHNRPDVGNFNARIQVTEI